MSYRSSSYRNKRTNPFSSDGYPSRKKFSRSNNEIYLTPIDWQRVTLSDFKRDFYKEHPDVSARSSKEVNDFLKEKEISADAGAPRPIFSFEESGLPDYILQAIKKLRFEKPTPIQSQSWPVLLSGKDMVGIAATGSGKTLAFLVPAIIHINAQKPVSGREGPIALVVAPTRELAMQIEGQIPTIAQSSRIRFASIFGGVPKGGQLRAINRGVDIVVATPGRLLDFISTGALNLNRVTYLVLDEADRMLDMGFEPQIRQVLSQIRPDRQTLLFSATWPKEIQTLASEVTGRSIHVNIGSLGISSCKNVTQEFEVVDPYNKEMKLLFYLRQLEKNEKVLVFVATKVMSDRLCKTLCNSGFYSGAINGDKRQYERDQIMMRFRNGDINILIGTDVASRGIDIKDIRVVINFDFPNTIEDYVHRIGRTGRAKNIGKSYTLLTRENANKAGDLIQLLNNDKKEIPPQIRRLYQMHGGRKSNNNRYRRR